MELYLRRMHLCQSKCIQQEYNASLDSCSRKIVSLRRNFASETLDEQDSYLCAHSTFIVVWHLANVLVHLFVNYHHSYCTTRKLTTIKQSTVEAMDFMIYILSSSSGLVCCISPNIYKDFRMVTPEQVEGLDTGPSGLLS